MGCGDSKVVHQNDDEQDQFFVKPTSQKPKLKIMLTSTTITSESSNKDIEAALNFAKSASMAQMSTPKSSTHSSIDSTEQYHQRKTHVTTASFSVDNEKTNPQADKTNLQNYWTGVHKVRNQQMGSFSLQMGQIMHQALSGRQHEHKSKKDKKGKK